MSLQSQLQSFLSPKIDWLANHYEIGLLGFVQTYLVWMVPINYEVSDWHTVALMAKDFGMVCGAMLTVLTLIAYVWTNIVKSNFVQTILSKLIKWDVWLWIKVVFIVACLLGLVKFYMI